MCLVIQERELKTSSEPVKCWKKLSYRDGVFISPYQGEEYIMGDNKSMFKFSGQDWCGDVDKRFRFHLPKAVTEIHEGYHSYSTLDRVSNYTLDFHDQILVECEIPAGTRYIVGDNDELVSLKLTVGKAVKGNMFLVKDFNGEAS